MDTQIKNTDIFLKLLWELVFPQGVEKGLLPVKQLAEESGIKVQTLYGKIEGNSKFSIEEAFRIAGVYAKHGEYTLANLILPEGYSIAPYLCTCTPNGSLQDDYYKLGRDLHDLGKKFDAHDARGAMRIIPKIKADVFEVQKEVEALA